MSAAISCLKDTETTGCVLKYTNQQFLAMRELEDLKISFSSFFKWYLVIFSAELFPTVFSDLLLHYKSPSHTLLTTTNMQSPSQRFEERRVLI